MVARVLAALILLALLPAPAQAGISLRGIGRTLWAPVRYAEGRVADLMDAVELNVGFGKGFKLDLKYGIHFLGIGQVRDWRLGVLDRRVGCWREIDDTLSLFPFSLLGWPVKAVARSFGDLDLAERAAFVATAGTLGIQYLDRKELCGDAAFILKDTVESWRHTRWGDSLPVGAEVHAGIVGVRAVVRPLQVVDFAVGFVGIDLDPWLDKTPF